MMITGSEFAVAFFPSTSTLVLSDGKFRSVGLPGGEFVFLANFLLLDFASLKDAITNGQEGVEVCDGVDHLQLIPVVENDDRREYLVRERGSVVLVHVRAYFSHRCAPCLLLSQPVVSCIARALSTTEIVRSS